MNTRIHTLERPTSRLAVTLLAIGALGLSLALLARPTVVQASGTIDWGLNGADNLPCANGAHWVLSPSDGIESATLSVDGTTYTMTQNGNGGSWAADSSGAVTENSTVFVTFTGPGADGNHLQLSHCLEAESSQSASESASQSASVPASQSASESASQSASESASQSTEGSVSAVASASTEGSVEAAVGSPGASVPNTAFSIDGSSPVLPILFALVMIAGLGAMAYANVRSSSKS